ncbi:hypothetical protein BGZ73_007989 [Actinomortierella ambigua]|nr:hypothetical protein BGZ73_007989 [Actinomortierella ambigua]
MNKNYSSWSLRPWIALKAIGVDFEERMVYGGTTHVPDQKTLREVDLLAPVSPSRKVPSLHIANKSSSDNSHHGTTVIFESMAILEFLAEHNPSLWPSDPLDRAYARSLALEMTAGMEAIKAYSMTIRNKFRFDPALFTADAERSWRRLETVWSDCREQYLAKKKKEGTDLDDDGFLFGHFTNLDAVYAPVMFRIETYQLRSKLTKPLAIEYVDRMLKYGPMREWKAAALEEPFILDWDEIYPLDQLKSLQRTEE